MAIEGNTKAFGLNEIIQTIAMNKNSGMMEIQCNDPPKKGLKKYIFFQKGNIIFIGEPQGAALKFENLLPRIGIVTKEAIDNLLKAKGNTPQNRQMLGSLIVENKVLPDKILKTIASKFYENELFEMLLWEDADFVFQMEATIESKYSTPIESYLLIEVPGERAVMEILRQIDEIDLIKKRIPDLTDYYILVPEKKEELKDIKLNPVQKRVLAKLDGSMNLLDILEEIFIGTFGIYQLMDMLAEKNLVRLLHGNELKEKGNFWRESGRQDRAIRLFQAALKKNEKDIETRIQLAELYKNTDHWEDAAREFGKIGSVYFDKGTYSTVIDYYKEALRLNPKDTDIQEKLFLTYLALEDFANAKKMAQTLYLIFSQEKKYDKIESIYRPLIHAEPSDISSKIALAEALSKKEDKNLSEAIILYEEIAQQYELLGRKDQALKTYKLLLEINPHHSGAFKKINRQQALEKGGLAGIWIQYKFWLLLFIALVIIAVGAFFAFHSKGG